jgi:hypothetical protein
VLEQGLLTPFDRLDGFERRVQPRANAGQPSTSGEGSTAMVAGHGAMHGLRGIIVSMHYMGQRLISSSNDMRAGRPHAHIIDEPFQKVAAQLAEIEANKHRSVLVDPSELPRKERAPPKVGELFWRQAASGKEAPHRKRRRQTLVRSQRKRPSLPSSARRSTLRPPKHMCMLSNSWHCQRLRLR